MEEQRGFLGKSRLKGLLLRTVEEVENIRKQNYGISYDCVHAAASFSRIFGRFVSYVQFETPKKPAYLILLDFPEENLRHVHNGMTGIASKYMGKSFRRVMPQLLQDVGNCDGAIIVNNAGKVVRVGAQLINLDTRKLLLERKRELGRAENPSILLGFGSEVGTRHTSALVAAYKHPGTKVVTLSEESGDIRVYGNGRIIATTNPKDTIHGLRKISRRRAPSTLQRIVALASL